MAGVDPSLSSEPGPDAIPTTPPDREEIWRSILLGTDKRYRESYTFLRLRATGHGDSGGAWLPIGIGVHTGVAYVGAVGEAPSTVITALGDTVNVAARLASAAGPGELLLSMDAARSAKLEAEPAERRDLELKGKSERVPVLVLGAT